MMALGHIPNFGIIQRRARERGCAKKAALGRANRKRILKAITDAKAPLTRRQIVTATGLSETSVSRGLTKLQALVLVQRIAPARDGFAPKYQAVTA